MPFNLWSSISEDALRGVLDHCERGGEISDIIQCDDSTSVCKTSVSQTSHCQLFDVFGSAPELVVESPHGGCLQAKIHVLGGGLETPLAKLRDTVQPKAKNANDNQGESDYAGAFRPVIVGKRSGFVDLCFRNVTLRQSLRVWLHRPGELPYATYGGQIDAGDQVEIGTGRMGWHHIVVQDRGSKELFGKWFYVPPLGQATWNLSDKDLELAVCDAPRKLNQRLR